MNDANKDNVTVLPAPRVKGPRAPTAKIPSVDSPPTNAQTVEKAKAAEAAATSPAAAPVAPVAAKVAPEGTSVAVRVGRAHFDHHMTTFKADAIAHGMSQTDAHNAALEAWRAGKRMEPPPSVRVAGIVVVQGEKRPPPEAGADRAAQFREQIGAFAQLLSRVGDKRNVPIKITLLPSSPEFSPWMRIEIGAAPGLSMRVEDEPTRAGLALGELLRSWDAEVRGTGG